MITITRRLALQLRTIFRRALNIRGNGPAVGFIAGKEGLTVKCMHADIAVEYHEPGERPAQTLWLPFEVLTAVEAKKDAPVELEETGKDEVTARWQDGSVPQLVKYNAKEPFDKFPSLPDNFASNSPRLLEALHEASEVAAMEGVRFATNCLQLCPDGTINATDGRQGLAQSGFTFPWSEPMLVPRSKVFNSPELRNQPVGLAQSGDWAVLNAGAWTVYLQHNTEGRYPDLSRHVPSPDAAKNRCLLSKDDAKFLAETLPKLPANDEHMSPVTLDVNGHIAVRAKPVDQDTPTEVALTNSSCTGEPIRININRDYLNRALKLGLQDVCLYGDDAVLLAYGEDRKYVWMPLTTGSAIPPSANAIRIESPKGEAAPVQPSVQPKKKVSPMSETTTNTDSKAATTNQTEPTARKVSRKAKQQDLAALIDQAVQFRSALHGLMQQSSVLVKALKQHRRKNRAIQNTLESLKQLKTLGV